MRNRIAYEVIHAGYLKSAEKTMDLVVEFCRNLEAQQIISINLTHEGKAVVWYRER